MKISEKLKNDLSEIMNPGANLLESDIKIINANTKVESGCSLVEFAIDNEWNEKEIDYLISTKPSLLSVDNSENLLIKYKNNEILSKLVSVASPEELLEVPETEIDDENPALFHIAKSNNIVALKAALKKCSLETENKHGQNILSFYLKGIGDVNPHVLIQLINTAKEQVAPSRFNYFINSKDKNGETPFSQLVIKASYEKDIDKKESLIRLLKYLKTEGADVDLPDSLGVTPLLSSAIADDEVVFKELIAMGADVNKESIDGDSCLQQALIMENDSIISECIDNIESIKVRETNVGKHPIFESLMLDDPYHAMCVMSKMEDSIDIPNPSDNNNTPLICAIKNRSEEAVTQ